MANRQRRRATKTKIDLPKVDQVDNIIKISCGVVLVLVIFYLITTFIVNRKVKENNDNIEAVIQYQEILAGETFNQMEKEYYVIFYHFDNYETILYDYVSDRFKEKNEYLPLYKVDLDKEFNAFCLAEESNELANDASKLKVQAPTLIKIKDGQNILYLDEKESILSVLMP